MTVSAFEGPAGYGKTFALLKQLEEDLRTCPLNDHQRVLALTFMHGARRRLEATLRDNSLTRKRFEAVTLDSFAWRLCQRWRTLARELGEIIPNEAEYDQTCSLAARLLREDIVRDWVAGSYPIVLVDEAQDLSRTRLEILKTLHGASRLLVAHDEFQCLNPDLRPVAIVEWLPEVCMPERLSIPRRTNSVELLAAAAAIRSGESLPTNSGVFAVQAAPHRPKQPPTFAAVVLASRIRRRRGSFAILTPNRKPYSMNAIDMVRSGPVGKQGLGPYLISWEESESDELAAIRDAFPVSPAMSFSEASALLRSHSAAGVRSALFWLDHRRRAWGVNSFTRDEILARIQREIEMHRRYQRPTPSSRLAMTIHQAKNREFDHVVVLWPTWVGGDAEQKRRLLYNAVTRAKQSCVVIVENSRALNEPPFVAEST